MLERTAAGLESCNLHRVLSPARRRAANKAEPTCQRLRTGFWQHGASAIELSAVWPATPVLHPQGAQTGNQYASAVRSNSEQQQQQVLQASAFLLDFLYPVATHSLLRKIYPNFSATADTNHGPSGSRHFTRSAPVSLGSNQTKDANDSRRTREEVEALMFGTITTAPKPSNAPNPTLNRSRRSDRPPRGSTPRDTTPEPKAHLFSKLSPNTVLNSTKEASRLHRQKASKHGSKVDSDLEVEENFSEQESWEPPIREGGFLSRLTPRNSTPEAAGVVGERPRPITIHKALKMTEQEMASNMSHRSSGSLKYLHTLLTKPQAHRFEDVWEGYKRLGPRATEADHGSMILYLSQSDRTIDAGRSAYLIRFVKEEEWTEQLQAAVILVHLRNDQLDSALVRFKEGLKKRGFSAGLDYILADALFRRKWSAVTEAWLSYHHANVVRDDVVTPTLDQLHQLPDLGKRYILYEKWLAQNNLEWEIRVAHPEIPANALDGLKTLFSDLALEHPCNARKALVILNNRREPELYKEYLLRMIQRWYDKLDQKEDLFGLANVYRTYRDLEGASFSVDLLHKLFNYFYPDDVQSLELLYQDWQRSFGDLDQRGFEKYLKLYAHLGDVDAVNGLWSRYTKLFPSVLSQNMAFRSLLNVHAQKGDVKAIEAEMKRMKEEHGVTPDVDDWNMLLKCYVRSDEYRETMDVFNQLRQHVTPNSWTYVHLLSMTAKKGLLEETAKYFTQLQKERVPVTKEMLLPLVIAYCRHSRYEDAEKALKGLAAHNIVSPAAWNELLRNFAMKTDMERCQQLLQTMKEAGVHSNKDTHANMLSAMVKANQPWSTYRYLKKAYSDRLIPLIPEYFDISMAGAVRGQEWDLVRKLQQLMFKTRTPMTFNAHVSVVEAAHRAKASSGHASDLAEKLPDYLRSAFQGSHVDRLQLPDETEELEEEPQGEEGPKDWFDELQDVFDYTRKEVNPLDSRDGSELTEHGFRAPFPEKTPPKDGRQLRKDTSQVGRAIRLLIEMKDYKTADLLLEIYLDLFPQFRDESFHMPNGIASALMMSHFNAGDFEKVRSMWDMCFQHTVRKARVGSKVLVGHQYDLCRPFDVVIRAFREQADGQGLLALVQELTTWGFKFSQSNWTLAIRYLAELEEVGAAMSYCEKLLMPGWKGWGDRRVDKDERREYNDTRRLRATPAVILALQREWLRMQGLAAWNGPISRLVQQIEQSYPRLYAAFASSELGTYQLRNKWVIDDKLSFEDSVRTMLAEMSLRDLSQFKIVLQGWLVQRHWISKAPASPFKRRVFDEFEGKTILRNLKVEELETLQIAVREAIAQEQDRRKRLGNRGAISEKEHMDEYHEGLSGRVRRVLEARRKTDVATTQTEPPEHAQDSERPASWVLPSQFPNQIVGPRGKWRIPLPKLPPLATLPDQIIGPSKKLYGGKLVLGKQDREAYEKNQALAAELENKMDDEGERAELNDMIEEQARRQSRKARVDPRFEELYGPDYDPLDPNFDFEAAEKRAAAVLAKENAEFASKFDTGDKDSLNPPASRRRSRSEVDAMWSPRAGVLSRQAQRAEQLRLLQEMRASENGTHSADSGDGNSEELDEAKEGEKAADI